MSTFATTTDSALPQGPPPLLSKDAVLRWLRENNYTQAHEALEAEADSPSLTERQDTQAPLDGTPTRSGDGDPCAELGRCVTEALSAYQQVAGDGSVYALLERWDPTFLPTYHTRRAMGGNGLERSDLERRLHELQEGNARQRAREREVDAQLRQTVAIIAERLQALVASVDPMRKDILLPLLRTVALLGASASARAAARHMMLTLYKRPITEHRLAIVQEWLRVARETPTRSLEQELIPELYLMVNAPAFERRLLALDCAAAAAPLLGHSPQVRYSLCQGLLRPLCEDEAPAVRRELPRCLSLLWGEAAPPAGVTPGVGGGADIGVGPARAAAQPSRSHAPPQPSAAAAAAADSNARPGASLSSSQQAFVMELLVHLATDPGSRSVRQAAQTQLCEVLYPVFLSDGVLLTQFVPLLLTVISTEATQMLLLQQRRPSSRSAATSAAVVAGGSAGPGAAAPAATLAPAAAAAAGAGGAGVGQGTSASAGTLESRRRGADDDTAAVASALSLSNVMTLVQLLHAALRCVAAEVVHSREEPERLSCGGAAHATSLADTYVQVVLPTAHTLLVPLLAQTRNFVAVGEDIGGGAGGSVQHLSSQLCGPLCALCATLASLVPLLGAEAWVSVTHFLQASVQGPAAQAAAAETALGFSSPSSSFAAAAAAAVPHDSAQGPHEQLRGRLLFAYAYLILLSGDAAVLPTSHGTVTGHACVAAPESVAAQEQDNKRQPSAVALSATAIQDEGLAFVTAQIRLESDSLASRRSIALTSCVQCVAALAPFAVESREVASGLTALLRYLVTSADPRLRLTAVVLAHDACAVIAHERLKVALLIEPLVALLEDLQPLVQEAALSGILAVASALTEPRAQEKAIRPVVRVADNAGCTSRFTRCVLVQWDQLLQRMPAEPREALLYPQLAALMDRLAEQYVERVSREGTVTVPTRSAEDGAAASRVPVGDPQDGPIEQWESTMLLLQALLHNILRCAVVTPTLVSRFLLPGIQQLASEGVLAACSSNVRTRWHRLLKSYLQYTESNSSRFAFSAGNPSGGNLLDRMKDELKRRL